ncbi:MAG: 50S ribosomal protein L17 [Clostridiaceae bacterium BRH_c20a]|nr:MAG: 50S ribosomal protein L17 [Clostridiaceae bacterium BRH_c20a]
MSYRKLGRPSSQRRAMLKNMATSLLKYGRVETTEPKAKEVRRVTEKMITLGKSGDLHARRLAMAYLLDETVVKELFDTIAPKFAERQGGYTRIMKTGPRRGDSAPMAIVELVE